MKNLDFNRNNTHAAHRVIKNTGFLYARMGITMFISLYTTRIILNSLGVSDFGVFNIVGGAIAMLGFLNAAMASATQRFISYSEGEGDKQKQTKIFNISVVLHFVIAILIGIVLLIAGWFFFHGILNVTPERMFAAKVVYGSLIISTIFTVITVPYDAVLNAHENMLYYSIVGILESLLKLGVALITVIWMGDKLILYGILTAIVTLITMTITRIYCHRTYSECVIAPRQNWDKVLMKEMTGFAGWNLLGAASGMISQYGLGIVLNNFFGTVLNAAQGIANQISGQLMAFSNTIIKAVNPIVAKSEGGGNRNLMITASLLGSKLSFLLLAFFAIPFIIDTSYILQIWLKNVPAWAVVFTRLQLIRSLIEQLTVMISTSIAAQGNIRFYTIIRSVLNILPIVLTYLFFRMGFPPYILYVVWIFAGGFLGGVVSLYYAKLNCGLNISHYRKTVLYPCLLVACVMIGIGVLPLYLMNSSFIRLILITAITSILFLGVLYYFVLSSVEKNILRQVSVKLISRIK